MFTFKSPLAYFILLLILAQPVSPIYGNEPSPIQIKRFRFHKHTSLNFERLVLEFSNRSGGKVGARVRMTPTGNGKETLISLSNVQLVGAIPEAAINEAYSHSASYFGPIAINNDVPSQGFAIRTFVKAQNAMVDAFWLENPGRLILDVYPRTSPRAQGPEVLISHSAHRGVASHHGGALKSGKGNVVCFYASAQVLASLGFERGQNARNINMVVDDSGASYSQNDNNVVCYPISAQAQPRVSFNMRNQPQKVTLDLGQHSVAPPTGSHEPVAQNWGAGRPLNKEEQTNRDADLALGLPGDSDLDGRGLASPGLFSGVDNFNKNNPPPTLGKQLLPPQPQGNPNPQMAGPMGGLLPPIK